MRTYRRVQSTKATSEALGVPRSTVGCRLAALKAAGRFDKDAPHAVESAIEIPHLPNGMMSADELLDRRSAEYKRRNEYETARKLIGIKVKDSKPIGVLFFGDPHLDDAGCDIDQLRADVKTVQQTDGLYGASIGDNQNNWIGRLSYLYGHQETTEQQSWQLVEWFVDSLGKPKKWLMMVNGNHDIWSGVGDPLKWMQRQQGILEGNDAVRVALRFPNGKEFRIAARHNWPGNSIWNANHGQLRAAYLQVNDHLIIGGHKHSGGDQRMYLEAADIVAHAIQLGSYKIHDSFGKTMGFLKTQIAPSCLVIIDPNSTHIAGFSHVYYDCELGARVLKAMRK